MSQKNVQGISIDDIQISFLELRNLQNIRLEVEMQKEELVKAKNELKESRNKYSILYDFSPISYFILDKNGKIIDVNLTGANKLEIERKDIIDDQFDNYIIDDCKSIFKSHIKQVFKSNIKHTCEIELLNKYRKKFDVRLESILMQREENIEDKKDQDFDKCQTAVIDITELKKKDEQILEQVSLLDKAHDAIFVVDMRYNITYWNKGCELLYGWTKDEIIGTNAKDILSNKKQDNQKLIDAEKKLFEDKEWSGELYQITKDGKDIIVDSSCTLVYNNGDNGKRDPKSILVINSDITEKNKLERQLLHSQRMESIGTLAGGIAHDLNNILTPIMLSIQILKDRLNDEKSGMLLDIIEKNSQRGADLIKQVLSFSRGIEGEREIIQIKHIINEIYEIINETFPKNIEVNRYIEDDLWTVLGDCTQLHQVLMNICINARDAMPDGGLLKISARNAIIDESYISNVSNNNIFINNDMEVGKYILISITDTGTGISHKILPRIFEPFFTTKERYKGTGLGLSTTLAIIKSHKGYIDVTSETKKGTTFNIYLPIKNKINDIEKKTREIEPHKGRGELILIADDEEAIRNSISTMLENYGYKVMTANDGIEALALYAQNIDKIKVILMDMMMPIMNGQSSIRAIRKINSDVKIIAMSGMVDKENLKIDVNHYLWKPYSSEILLKKIYDVLNK